MVLIKYTNLILFPVIAFVFLTISTPTNAALKAFEEEIATQDEEVEELEAAEDEALGEEEKSKKNKKGKNKKKDKKNKKDKKDKKKTKRKKVKETVEWEADEDQSFGDQMMEQCCGCMMDVAFEMFSGLMSGMMAQWHELGYQPYPFENDETYIYSGGRGGLVNLYGGWQYVDASTDTWRIGGMLAFRGSALELDFSRYTEDYEGGSDKLSIGDALFTFALPLANCHLRFGTGYGGIKGEGSYHGVKFAARLRYFIRPVRFEFRAGATLGDFNPVYDNEAGIGFHLGRCDITAGYRIIQVGEESIHGPEAGVGVWF